MIHTDKVFFSLPTLHDPILMKYANKEDSGTTVFATDSVLSTLMASIKSVYSWDITILKENNKVYLDYRESGNFEYLSVNENAAEPPMESPDENNPNTPVSLSYEATKINKSFSQQVLNVSSSNLVPSIRISSTTSFSRFRFCFTSLQIS